MTDEMTRNEILRALFDGTLTLTDFKQNQSRTEHRFEMKYETEQASVYVQMEPQSVQAYDQPNAEGNMLDMSWDELTNDGELYGPTDDEYVKGYLDALEAMA